MGHDVETINKSNFDKSMEFLEHAMTDKLLKYK